MTTPTPEEITAARELLLRVPGVDGGHSLNAVAEIASPLVQMARELRTWLQSSTRTPDLGQLASQLESVAARHGLRITTDHEPAPPGSLIGYTHVRACGGDWVIATPARLYSSNVVRAERPTGLRTVALYLLPEGGR
ncbi:hypothetical protein ACTWPB_07485 [Nocardia sp. IBHARD005]|uniref:hypothetical protein n=1 Tax=Nocardia sp. IBHARD005 TaxID=3457765 RepID=UPI00405808AE